MTATTQLMITSLPVVSSAALSDILMTVQGYVSPSVLGTSKQENLQQIFTLFQVNGSANLPLNSVVVGASLMQANNGYIANYGLGVINFTLPSTSSVGNRILVLGNNAGLWKIVQGTGQQIFVGSQHTTVTSGSITSTGAHDSIELICTVANLTWQAASTPVGTLTFV